jgi:hypothetical protein
VITNCVMSIGIWRRNFVIMCVMSVPLAMT